VLYWTCISVEHGTYTGVVGSESGDHPTPCHMTVMCHMHLHFGRECIYSSEYVSIHRQRKRMVEHSQVRPKEEDQEEQSQSAQTGDRATDHGMDQGGTLLVRAIQPIQDIMVSTVVTIALFFAIVLVSTIIQVL